MKKFLPMYATALLVSLMLCLPALANELHIGTGKGYQSLTAAVVDAAPGDVIHLSSGVYDEPAETYPIESTSRLP